MYYDYHNHIYYDYHQQCTRVLFSPYCHKNLTFLFFLMTVILTGINWYIILIVKLISLMISDAEHLLCICWPYICLLKNICSDPPPVLSFKSLLWGHWIVWVLYIFCIVLQSLSCIWLWIPMDCRMPDFPVLHHLSELAQTHVHWVCDAIQPSHPLSSSSPPDFNLSQHQGIFQWVRSSH